MGVTTQVVRFRVVHGLKALSLWTDQHDRFAYRLLPSHSRSQKSEVRCQKSEVRCQKSEVRSQMSDVGSQKKTKLL